MDTSKEEGIENFFAVVAEFTDLSAQSKLELEAHLKRQLLPKGHILVKPDSTCNFVYFVESGLTRTFYMKDGKDVTDWISDEHSFACSIISFVTRMPDRRGIELLEDSELYALYYNDLEKLSRQYHDIERLYRKLLSLGLVQLQRKFDDLHFTTALERYRILMEHNPSFIRRVPLGMIASYLGMTQETLSRIRSQL